MNIIVLEIIVAVSLHINRTSCITVPNYQNYESGHLNYILYMYLTKHAQKILQYYSPTSNCWRVAYFKIHAPL